MSLVAVGPGFLMATINIPCPSTTSCEPRSSSAQATIPDSESLQELGSPESRKGGRPGRLVGETRP